MNVIFIILIILIYVAYRIYKHYTFNTFLKKDLTDKLHDAYIELNYEYREQADKIIDKFWGNLNMKEREELIKYCGYSIWLSNEKGLLEVSDLNELKEMVKNKRDKYNR